MSLELNGHSELSKEQGNLERLLRRTNDIIAELSGQRDERLASAVPEYLPTLTRGVRARLDEVFPDFLTDDRRDTFNHNAKVFFGLFNRPTTATALLLLRVQFRAFLEQTDFCREQDEELRRLANQKIALTRELQNVTRLLAGMKPVTEMPGVRVDRASSHRAIVGQTRTGMSVRTVERDDVVVDGSGDDLVDLVILNALANEQQQADVVVLQDATFDGATNGMFIPSGEVQTVGGDGSSACISDFVAAAADAASGNGPDACVVIDTSDSLGCFS